MSTEGIPVLFHQCNNYVSSKVHASLIRSIDGAGDWSQQVVVPCRKQEDLGRNNLAGENTSVHYVRYWNGLRFLPFTKVFVLALRSLPFYLAQGSRHESIPVVAHNFWSDGAVVFLISLLMPNLRYVVVVRSTDVAIFFRKLPHLRWFMRLIAARSEGVLFVSPAHKATVERLWPKLLPAHVPVKVVGNGMSSSWTNDVCLSTEPRNPEVCFVGNFGANKNLRRLYEACKQVRETGASLTLNVIGGDEAEFKKVVGEKSLAVWVTVMGYIKDPEELKACYRRARVIAVPSFVETFGLVYIEALSQGASVICSEGQGVDGLIRSDFVEFIDPESVESIAKALGILLELSIAGVPVELRKSVASDFDWRRIRNLYLESLSLGVAHGTRDGDLQ